MWLVNITTLQLEEFIGDDKVPLYTILSHTWEDGEVSFQDMKTDEAKHKAGYHKVVKSCWLTLELNDDGINHVWIDTCCIDKSSSAELSEAINSMYRYYQNAYRCFVYLADAEPLPPSSKADFQYLQPCRWFRRSWTLQELIAPRDISFYAGKDWSFVGLKQDLLEVLTEVTGVDATALCNPDDLSKYSIAKRMSWASNRHATRVEDVSYSLLGIFDVNMPLLYGEGKKAFIRLQEEIMKQSDDQSLLAWGNVHEFAGFDHQEGQEPLVQSSFGFLAESPNDYQFSKDIVSFSTPQDQVWSMTNKGIQVDFPSFESNGQTIFVLNCYQSNDLRRRLSIPSGVALSDRRSRTSRNLFLVDHHTVTLRPERYYLCKSYGKEISEHDRTGGLHFRRHNHYNISPLMRSDRWEQSSQVFLQPRDRPKRWEAWFAIEISKDFEQLVNTPAQLLILIGVQDNTPWCEITTRSRAGKIYMTPSRGRFSESSLWLGSGLIRASVARENVMGQEMFMVEISKPEQMSLEEFTKGSARIIQGNILPTVNEATKTTIAGLSNILSQALPNKKK